MVAFLDLLEQLLNCQYILFQGIGLWLDLIRIVLLHSIDKNITKKVQKQEGENEKRCRTGIPKSTQTRKDIKVKVNIQSPSVHLHSIVKRCRDEALISLLYLNVVPYLCGVHEPFPQPREETMTAVHSGQWTISCVH